MMRMAAEKAAEQANKKAPKGVSYYAALVQGEWMVNQHDGRRK